ncbi:hypothetical protein vseg_009748 [Gypsophila vaccaria]
MSSSQSSSNLRKNPPKSRHKSTNFTPKSPSSSWCCSFKSPPKSPETLISHSLKPQNPLSKPASRSETVSSSPQSSKSGLGLVGRIDPRKILSPGRVSPIDDPIANVGPPEHVLGPTKAGAFGPDDDVEEERECVGEYDVRLSLKGKNGGAECVVLEMNSRVLKDNSVVFGDLIGDYDKGLKKRGGFWRIEVPEVDDLGVFRDALELMFVDDVDFSRNLVKFGAYRVIDILEVSASIKFNRGVLSCIKYLEAVPWTEEEEEKLKKLFTKLKFDNATNSEIFSRLSLNDSNAPQQNLASQLVRSITACSNAKARNELKPMVKGLLSNSSVYEKDYLDITKEDLYSVCHSCLSSLVNLFREASDTSPRKPDKKPSPDKPLIESVSWQVENINWLLEILLDRHMAEDFVDMWANQEDLLDMHEKASPMVRYELSRISATLFIAMGTRKLQCPAESRFGLLHSWFGPMLVDFGWLKRCRKGLNVPELEEAMGQALLTLPLKQQYTLFMEWFRCFSKHGTECPNLSKAFQIWWRRSFLRGSETRAIESR